MKFNQTSQKSQEDFFILRCTMPKKKSCMATFPWLVTQARSEASMEVMGEEGCGSHPEIQVREGRKAVDPSMGSDF